MRVGAGRLLLALGSGVLAIAAAEALFRAEEGTVIFPWEEPGRGFATRPHTRGSNAWGFHEREIAPEDPPRGERVAVLGDSMTWGTGTAEQTWTAVAERAAAAAGVELEVLNFGHYGYDAEASAATLRHQAARWRPARVVFASYTNDVLPNTTVELGRWGYPVWIGARGALLPGPLRRASALARAVEGAWRSRGLAPTPDLARYEAALADMAAQAEALGAGFEIVALVPQVFAGQTCEADAAFCAEHRAWYEAQRAVWERRGWSVLPAEPILDRSGEESFYPANEADHDHLSVAGQRVLGEGVGQTWALREILRRHHD